MLIHNCHALKEFVQSTLVSEKGGFICVDTEFRRETTYWPELCLVQIATSTQAVVIDALAVDIHALLPLLTESSILKVFHSGRQDLEIFLHDLGCLPYPYYDTQIAAMYASMGESISYDNLIHKMLGCRVDKTLQYTDWTLRPLNERQIQYALSDVTYLRQVYPLLCQRLEDMGRSHWPLDEMAIYTDPAHYGVDVHDVWLRVHMSAGKGQSLAFVQDLAAWRELKAQQLNYNRSRVLKDEVLVKLSLKAPGTKADLIRLLPSAVQAWGDEIWDVLEKTRLRPMEDWPHWPGRAMMNPKHMALHDFLKLFQKQRAEDLNLPARLLIGRGDLEKLAQGEREDVACFNGWRFEAFGQDLQDLLQGRKSLTIEGERLTLKAL